MLHNKGIKGERKQRYAYTYHNKQTYSYQNKEETLISITILIFCNQSHLVHVENIQLRSLIIPFHFIPEGFMPLAVFPRLSLTDFH
jgi:hypothetical protein